MNHSTKENYLLKVTKSFLFDFNSLSKTKVFCLLVMALFTLSCNNQSQSNLSDKKEIASNGQEIQLTNYGAGDIVTSALLDSKGNMWFTTTKEGVFRYDGNSFINLTKSDGLCADQVWSVVEDKNGVMWFGTAKGLCSYDGKSFQNIPIPKDNTTSDWLKSGYPIINPSGIIGMIQDKNGIFWIGSNGGGAYRYDGKTFTSLLKNKGRLQPDSLYHNVITSVVEDTAGNVWFSSFSHGGITKYDGTIFTHYGIEEGLADDMISTSYVDKSGTLWFGTRGGGMTYFNGKNFTNIIEKEGVCANHMASLHEDKRGKLWVASYARKGVCWYDGKDFRPFQIEGSEDLNDIKFISEDKEGNIWLGGRYGILWRYDGKVLTNFTDKQKH